MNFSASMGVALVERSGVHVSSSAATLAQNRRAIAAPVRVGWGRSGGRYACLPQRGPWQARHYYLMIASRTCYRVPMFCLPEPRTMRCAHRQPIETPAATARPVLQAQQWLMIRGAWRASRFSRLTNGCALECGVGFRQLRTCRRTRRGSHGPDRLVRTAHRAIRATPLSEGPQSLASRLIGRREQSTKRL
jgi:hypothetical protein